MSTELIGQRANGYEILSQLGQGGMASVYLARQESMNRNVALKILPRAFMKDDAYLQRFEREVAIVAQLEHRNIVPVYDYGEFAGQPYIAMRYMPAGSVEDLLALGRIPLPRVLSIIEQVAAALDYAWQKDILHRDLKPSNILLDDGGGVFITDFGIARILSDAGQPITTQGVVGTPSYMSPEQAQGEPLDGRSDVYSLGVMLFELVTGRRPFESDTAYSIAVMHVTSPPPAPSSYESSVSPALEAVILRALRKAPPERYASAGELAAALRQALEEPFAREPALVPTIEPGPGPAVGPAADRPPLGKRRPFSVRLLLARGTKSIWLGIAAGGALGCALLLGLLALGFSMLGLLSLDDALPHPATAAATERPDSPLAATLAALNAAADATFTAQARFQPLPPTASPAAISPGDRPTLNAALQAVEGELVYFAKSANNSGGAPVYELVVLDLKTWHRRTFGAGGNSLYPQPSPDGRWIAFQSDRDGDFEIYVVNRQGGQLRQITDNAHRDRLPAWSPDGTWIIYSADVRGDETFDLYRVRPNGTEAQPLYSDGWRNSHARYSSDGATIVFSAGPAVHDARTWEIRHFDLRAGATQLLTKNEDRDASPLFSPNGQRILYVTTINGQRVLASMDLAGAERELLFSGPGSVWAASYSPAGEFIVATVTIDGTDQLFLLDAQGGNAQQITTAGGAYAAWLPPLN